MTLSTTLRKSMMIAMLALMASVVVAGGADARSNPDDGEVSGPYHYVIRANSAVLLQDILIQPPFAPVGK